MRWWILTAIDAVHKYDFDAIHVLLEVARSKAFAIETSCKRAGLKEWRQWIRGSAGEDTHGPASPCRAAYRWLRRCGGWTHSSVGP
eukprot:12233624-Karenia_brevis.AAC.1